MILLLVGLVGAPNKGKSTIFSAMTANEVQIADYAFTTIKPNLGVAYASRRCAEIDLGIKCRPRNSVCKNGFRQIPINIIDVAGLVPGAHLGKGRGNQFLNDLINAEVIIQVVDISGKTDMNGAGCEGSDPAVEVEMIRNEMAAWLGGIITSHISSLSNRSDGDVALLEILSGLKSDIDQIRRAASANSLPLSGISWKPEKARAFAKSLLKENKPLIIAANKMDRGREEDLEGLRKKLSGVEVIPCSGAIELALVKAANKGMIDYVSGMNSFNIVKEASSEQKSALSYMQGYIKDHGGTGIQALLDKAVFGTLDNLVVYPVEDESHYADHSGNILPDAILMRKGSTAYDLAAKIHTDIAKGMKYAIDARTKMRLQKDYVLKDGDVIKIVTH